LGILAKIPSQGVSIRSVENHFTQSIWIFLLNLAEALGTVLVRYDVYLALTILLNKFDSL
jgi:hypothetical protein